jgi:hypothetical protein
MKWLWIAASAAPPRTAARVFLPVIAGDEAGGGAVVINKPLTLSHDARIQRLTTRIFSAS